MWREEEQKLCLTLILIYMTNNRPSFWFFSRVLRKYVLKQHAWHWDCHQKNTEMSQLLCKHVRLHTSHALKWPAQFTLLKGIASSWLLTQDKNTTLVTVSFWVFSLQLQGIEGFLSVLLFSPSFIWNLRFWSTVWQHHAEIPASFLGYRISNNTKPWLSSCLKNNQNFVYHQIVLKKYYSLFFSLGCS